MTDKTAFYHLDGGGVARWITTATTDEIAIWSPGAGAWVDAPYILGKIVGIGGDGHATEITRDEARAAIDGASRPAVRGKVEGVIADARDGSLRAELVSVDPEWEAKYGDQSYDAALALFGYTPTREPD